ncbi:methyl-accepting chemotaxis sensory transducer [Crinalium epipsammum PCC 9333]|uniref:Methyl-accepting chemotaxis sensory transducer n=1 Tax=Crinalium epipsammum PCC 9333 TaxID=1173022 RepID=K9VYB9_9CYAN|nr:CHASE3 domain-containing protein [Crinalium epipsammum]AFZ13113.1 methyl-accepting chemotaxis sensory transducer [Crinalium epipsammum PCC 9333]
MQSNIKLGKITKIGFGTIIALMVGIGISSKVSTNRLVAAVNWVTHTYEVKAKLKGLEKDLVDAETGQRGFIFTGREDFLEPYKNSQKVNGQHFRELKELIKDNPKQIERLIRIEDLSQQKMSELAATIALKKANKEKELRSLVLSGRGKQVMDELRNKLDNMLEIEDDLLIKRQEEAKQAEQISSLISLGGTSAAIALGVFTLLFIDRKVVRPINQVSNNIARASTEIAAAVDQQERSAAHQATAVTQTTTTMDELGASSRQAADQAEASVETARKLLYLAESSTTGARQALSLAESSASGARQVLSLAESSATGARQVLTLAESGNESVRKTQDGMSTLKEKVGAIAEHIMRLSEQTTQIGSITNLVTDLANQTNMLSLNAAVEAARAGENGKGFGVVASEIRKLADQSKRSAEKINTLITDIQNAINVTVMVTDEGKKNAEEGIKLTQETAVAFNKVSQAINDVVLEASTNVTQAINDVILQASVQVNQAINDVILNNQENSIIAINDVVVRSQQISLTAKQQAIAIQQVVEAMNNLNQAAMETASGLNQTKAETQQLNTAALNLQTVV